LHTYEDIISVENLLAAWKEFIRGKRKKTDVQEFQLRLMQNILALHTELKRRVYVHGDYHAFTINDPKRRDIHKASVRDRLVHHALHRMLYPFFDRSFIFDSYSCRTNKGTHAAMRQFTAYAQVVSRNHTRTCWVLKCDIKKFFASVDHSVLVNLIAKKIFDVRIMNLIQNILTSFSSTTHGKGLPLGNLTSQLFVNIYMNEFDQFVKHALKQKYYVRYADDFGFMSHGRNALVDLLPQVRTFLETKLCLQLHPNKVQIQTYASGADFLGWVHFDDHKVLRTVAKRRMYRRLREAENVQESMRSYMGLLGHGNARGLQNQISLKLKND
jgi:RNA-directed DNA polymerase